MEYVERITEDIFHIIREKSHEGEDEGLRVLDFDEIYNEYSKMVFHIAVEKVDDFHMAEDIVQEVFLKMNRKMYLFHNQTHVKAWLLRVTNNECVDYTRRQTVDAKQKIEKEKVRDSIDTIESLIELWDAQGRVDEVFEKLWGKNPRWYYITMEYYYGQKTIEELAEEFELNRPAVSSLLYRIRKWMGKELLKQNRDLKRVYENIL